jgi:mitogen-activated protein kinase kinase kinase
MDTGVTFSESLPTPGRAIPFSELAKIKNKPHVVWQKGGVIGQGSFGKVLLGLNVLTGELLAVKQVILDDDSLHYLENMLSQEVETSHLW